MTLIIADAPMKWDDSLPGENRGAATAMHPLTLEQICRTPLPQQDDDSVLLLWRPPARMRDALTILDAWGFQEKTDIVWKKLTVHGARHFGMGRIVRSEHETCIVAVKGKPHVTSHSVRSVFEAHAEPYHKPEAFYDLVRELWPGHAVWERLATTWSAGWKQRGVRMSGVHVRHVRQGASSTASKSVRPAARASHK